MCGMQGARHVRRHNHYCSIAGGMGRAANMGVMAMMTKKDYECIANVLRKAREKALGNHKNMTRVLIELTSELSSTLAHTNGNFDIYKFNAACMPREINHETRTPDI